MLNWNKTQAYKTTRYKLTCITDTDCTQHYWLVKLTGLLLSYATFDTQAANLIHVFVSWMCSFDWFTSTFIDKLFKVYDMEIHNQIFYTTMCSCLLSLTGNCLMTCTNMLEFDQQFCSSNYSNNVLLKYISSSVHVNSCDDCVYTSLLLSFYRSDTP